MNDAARLTGLAALAVAAGVGLYFLTQQPEPAPEVAVERSAPERQNARRLAKLAAEEEVPEEYRQVDRYIQERFGHLANQPESLANVDASGNETIYMRKVIPAWTPNGTNYLTGVAQARQFDGLLITARNSDQFAPAFTRTVPLDKPPGDLGRRLARTHAPITRAEDMPEEHRDFFPTDEKIAEWQRLEEEARERELAEQAADREAARAALEAAEAAEAAGAAPTPQGGATTGEAATDVEATPADAATEEGGVTEAEASDDGADTEDADGSPEPATGPTDGR